MEGKNFLEPEVLFGAGHLGETGVDEWASAILKFPNGVIAEVSCSIMAEQDNTLRIIGSRGRIEVKDFWYRLRSKGRRRQARDRSSPVGTHETIETQGGTLALFLRGGCGGRCHPRRTSDRIQLLPGMELGRFLSATCGCSTSGGPRSASNIRRGKSQLLARQTIAGGALTRGNSCTAARTIAGTSTSRLSVCRARLRVLPELCGRLPDPRCLSTQPGAMLFDTAYVYAGGKTEAIFGDWHTESKAFRGEEIVADRQGRPFAALLSRHDRQSSSIPFACPAQDRSMSTSISCIATIPTCPVGEFVDAMDAEVKRRPHPRTYSAARTGPASALRTKPSPMPKRPARRRRRHLSNNFSLAEMLDADLGRLRSRIR